MTETFVDSDVLSRLLDPATRPDPYPLYAQLRAAGPVQRIPGLAAAVVSTYDACAALLRDPRVRSDRRTGGPGLQFRDPPDHTRLRRLVGKAFTARTVQQLTGTIRDAVDDLLDAAAEAGSLDVLADLAHPLPVTVLCRLLGVPAEDEPEVRAWSDRLAAVLDPAAALTGSAGAAESCAGAAEQASGYFAEAVRRRRDRPGDDLLSALLAVRVDGDALSAEELVSTCVLLLAAGHETTVNLVANATLALLRHPAELAALTADPDRADAVVEETLRYDPPVQLVARQAGAEVEVAGERLEEGMLTLLLLAGAHRDPAAVSAPERFDPDRPEIRHLAFGHGAHYCLGAPLARLEAQLAVRRLVQRVVAPELAGEPPYKPHLTLRGVAALAVTSSGIRDRATSW